jgi:hypothetical protein
MISTDQKHAVSKVRTMDSGFKVKIFTEKLLALDPFGPWSNFLSLGHCLVKRDVEYSTGSCSNC